jgi:hypothetical protein
MDNNQNGGFLDRYDDGGMTVFVCVSGIIASITAFFTFSKNWVSVSTPFGQDMESTLLEVSGLSKTLSGVTQYFDPQAASTLNAISLVSTASYWALLLGAIALILVSLIILIAPKAEIVVFIPAVVITAFAIIGLVFTALPVLAGQYMHFTPVPLAMLIISGIPAAVFRFLG